MSDRNADLQTPCESTLESGIGVVTRRVLRLTTHIRPVGSEARRDVTPPPRGGIGAARRPPPLPHPRSISTVRHPELKVSTLAHTKHMGWHVEFESRVTQATMHIMSAAGTRGRGGASRRPPTTAATHPPATTTESRTC